MPPVIWMISAFFGGALFGVFVAAILAAASKASLIEENERLWERIRQLRY